MVTKINVGIGFQQYQGDTFKTDVTFSTKLTFENLRPQRLLDLRSKVQSAGLKALGKIVGLVPKPEVEDQNTKYKTASITISLQQKDPTDRYDAKCITLLNVQLQEPVAMENAAWCFDSQALSAIAEEALAESTKEVVWALGEPDEKPAEAE